MRSSWKSLLAVVSAILAFVFVQAQPVRAGTLWWVAPGGSDSNDCLSVGTACKTIQAAINKAASNDTVRVEPGTYSNSTNGESFPITITYKGLVLFGNGLSNTTIDAGGSGQNVFTIGGNNTNVYISAFTIQGGIRGIELNGYYPGYIQGVIGSNRLTGNTTGLYLFRSRHTVEQNDISGNSSYGIYTEADSDTLIRRNVIAWNGTGYDSAAIHIEVSSGTIVNNAIGWNNGTGIWNTGSSPNIINNSIAWNYGGSGISSRDVSTPTIANNIVVLNGVYGLHTDATSLSVTSYNDVWQNGWGNYWGTPAGVGSLSANPLFAGLFDWHLLCSSPAINRGNDAAWNVPSEDYYGAPRPVGGRIDMGAVERQQDLYCPMYLPFLAR